jgi:hypothetical protein
MSELSNVEQAERLSRRRARLLPVLAVFYLGQQVSFFSQHGVDSAPPVNHSKIGAWLVMTLTLLVVLTTSGFWFRNPEVRAMIDDESTRMHRANAMATGFIFAMLAGIALYFVIQFEPVSAREAIHVIISLGLGAALVRFGMLERRAHRLG